MGGSESRIEASESTKDLYEDEQEESEEATGSLHVTQDLYEHVQTLGMNDEEHVENHENHTHPHHHIMQEPPQFTDEQKEFIKAVAQRAYENGKKEAQVNYAEHNEHNTNKYEDEAERIKELEKMEDAKVQELVSEMNQRTYRAPLREVKCAIEREACLECYREHTNDILTCKEVAGNFARCAKAATEAYMQTKA